MNREEFIEKLRSTLSAELNYSLVNENVRYYEDYLDMEIRKGSVESEVLKRLGDPRLLAKTIIETNKMEGAQGASIAYEETVGDEEENTHTHQRRGMPVWITMLLVLICVIAVLGAFVSIIWSLLPILLVFAAVTWVLKWIKGLK